MYDLILFLLHLPLLNKYRLKIGRKLKIRCGVQVPGPGVLLTARSRQLIAFFYLASSNKMYDQ